MPNPYLILDIDGVLCDYATMAARTYYKHFPDEPRREIDRYDFWNVFDQPKIAKELTLSDIINYRNVCKQSLPYPSYKEDLEGYKILAKDFRILIVTARPTSFRMDTMEWLNEWEFTGYDGLVMSAVDKSVFPGNIMIDDYTVHLKAFDESRDGIAIPMAISRPWNKDWNGRRAENLKDAAEKITFMLHKG